MTENATSDRDEWPRFAEELGRKALVQLERWVGLYEAGKISARECYVALDTLYETIVGLANMADTDLIVSVIDELRAAAKKAKTNG